MSYKRDFTAVERFGQAMRQYPNVTSRHLEQGMTIALMLMQREIAERTPTGAHQLLRKSIIAQPVQKTESGLMGVVGTSLNYAVPVELGTKPHKPPVQPLIDWVIAKLGVSEEEAPKVANAIAWKIFHKGTEGAFMFRDGFQAQQDNINAILQTSMANAMAEIAGSAR